MLKAILLRQKIENAKKSLEELRLKSAEFDKRQTELENAIKEASEMQGEESEIREAQAAVESEVEKFDSEKKEHEEQEKRLESEIADLEQELAETEKAQEEAAEPPVNNEVREEKKEMINRTKFFGMSVEERDRLFGRDDVKDYLSEIRAVIKEKRELTNVGLTIPLVFIDLLREKIDTFSKLYKYTNLAKISGSGREIVMGSVPEGIWTECCAVLNELTIAFNDAEVDCFKVGGYFKVCNAVLEDSDVDLASTLLDALGQAIGKALDKAILYGRNTSSNQKMPLGIVSRLAQTERPSSYPATARAWVDLHESNIRTIEAGVTGAALLKGITLASGDINSDYSVSDPLWVMNRKTYTALIANTISTDANGNIVTGVAKQMPVIGGNIEVLNFIPDNVIIGGYFDNYLLAERAGAKFASSEHAFFIQDNTAFRGTARYDGQPVIAEAFIAIGINGTTPTSDMTFAADVANTGV